MNKHVAVIGANFGDEGKGRSVDYFVKQFKEEGLNPLVVRFSGSNNAAHTVYHKGKRTVFNLLGSGSHQDVPTYLYKTVLIDPVALLTELQQFKNNNLYTSKIFIDPRCQIILPYDVMLNRMKELSRGTRHGSTGNGLNEAVDRSEFQNLQVGSENKLEAIAKIRQIFMRIQNNKQFDECKKNMSESDLNFLKFLIAEDSHIRLLESVNRALKNFEIGILNLDEYSCVFEGSQGLALDEYAPNFPHVTRARTGSINIIDACRQARISLDKIYYVSRPYLSRHGNDPTFKEYDITDEYFNILDETNVENKWQGSLKFGLLDFDVMESRIADDFKVIKRLYPNIEQGRIFTCTDQIISKYPYLRRNDFYVGNEFEKTIKNIYHIKGIKDIMLFDSPENT